MQRQKGKARKGEGYRRHTAAPVVGQLSLEPGSRAQSSRCRRRSCRRRRRRRSLCMRRKTPFPSIISRSFLLISRRLELQKRVKEQRETPQVKGDPGAESFPGSKHSFSRCLATGIRRPARGPASSSSRSWALACLISSCCRMPSLCAIRSPRRL